MRAPRRLSIVLLSASITLGLAGIANASPQFGVFFETLSPLRVHISNHPELEFPALARGSAKRRAYPMPQSSVCRTSSGVRESRRRSC